MPERFFKMDHKYSVVVFDLGNVLLPFDYKVILEKLDKIERGLGEKFATYYRDNYDVHRKFERGELSSDEFADIMLDVLEHKIGKEDFFEIYSNMFSVNEDLVGVLPVLKKNYRLILLSNTNEVHREYGWQGNEFLRLFDKLILSHEVGAVKPEAKIYRAVESYTQVPPGEHFYIDDIAEYVAAGKKMGWGAVQFVGNEKLFAEFEKSGIIFRDPTD